MLSPPLHASGKADFQVVCARRGSLRVSVGPPLDAATDAAVSTATWPCDAPRLTT
jgi:hypothetical protein